LGPFGCRLGPDAPVESAGERFASVGGELLRALLCAELEQRT
jgi:hypothetical protein